MPEDVYEHLLGGAIKLHRQPSGQKPCIDSLLLAAAAKPEKVTRALDLGCGSGIVSLALAHFDVADDLVGVEIQPAQIALAQKNVTLNRKDGSIRIVQGDARKLRESIEPSSFDLVVCNPPYYPINSGRLNPDLERATARHELAGGLADFVKGARYALQPRGRLLVIYPTFRLPELLSELSRARFSIEWIQFVHPRPLRAAKLVLVQARKGGAPRLQIRWPIWLEEEDGGASEPIVALLDGVRPVLE